MFSVSWLWFLRNFITRTFFFKPILIDQRLCFWNNNLLYLIEQNIFILLLLTSTWRHTPLLFCCGRQAACLCKPTFQFSSRWQDALVWTQARAWKLRQEVKTSTKTWKEEEEGECTATEILSFFLFFFLLVSQQIPACARPSPVQVMPPASRLDRADTCASVLGATWGKAASWSQDSASQTGNSFYV